MQLGRRAKNISEALVSERPSRRFLSARRTRAEVGGSSFFRGHQNGLWLVPFGFLLIPSKKGPLEKRRATQAGFPSVGLPRFGCVDFPVHRLIGSNEAVVILEAVMTGCPPNYGVMYPMG